MILIKKSIKYWKINCWVIIWVHHEKEKLVTKTCKMNVLIGNRKKTLYVTYVISILRTTCSNITDFWIKNPKYPTKSFKSIKFHRFSRTHPFSQLRALHISASIESTYIYSSASFRSRSSAILHPISHFHGTPNKRCIILRPQSNGSNKCH